MRTRGNPGKARRGGGPRTPAGKARSRMNALRHGLAARFRRGEQAAEELDRVVRLARILAGGRGGAVLDCAGTLAESAVDLARARAVEVALIERWHDGTAPPPDGRGHEPAAQQDAGVVLLAAIARLDRYGRRARARRRCALLACAISGCVSPLRL